MASGKQVELIGKIFGKLTVISRANNILGGKTIKRYWGAWNCKCNCGKAIIVKTINLNRGSVKSCGCLYDEYGKSLKPGQKINRLTTISYKNGKWFCLCECGNNIEVSTDKLNSENTKSCGCLKSEKSSANSNKLIESRRQFDPWISSARKVWKSYCYRDRKCAITIEEFLILTKQNCFYCGIEPNTKYNHFLTISSNSSKTAKQEGLFIYNGIDRIDSGKHHTINNVVTACISCNRAKNNRSIDDFLSWIKTLQILDFNPINIIEIPFPTNGSLKTSIKCVFYNHKNDTDLTIEEYYSISQMNCFYCNSLQTNIFNRAKTDKKSSTAAKENGNYIYNGIDRIDVKLNHNKNNIVPCCKYCNFAKSNLSLKDFQAWIKRIQQYQENKKGPDLTLIL